MKKEEVNLKDITRLCIVDEHGRQYDRRIHSISIDKQDNNKTLKIFVNMEQNSK